MEAFDQIFIAVLVIAAFGAFSFLQMIWRAMLRVASRPSLGQAHSRESRKEFRDAHTQTWFDPVWTYKHTKTRLWTTPQGDKLHLFEDCQHIHGRKTFRQDGICGTCCERSLLDRFGSE